MCTTTSIPIAAMLAPRDQPASLAKRHGNWALENQGGVHRSRKDYMVRDRVENVRRWAGYTIDVPFGLAAGRSAISCEEVWYLSLEKSSLRSSMAEISSRPSGLVIAHSCMA